MILLADGWHAPDPGSIWATTTEILAQYRTFPFKGFLISSIDDEETDCVFWEETENENISSIVVRRSAILGIKANGTAIAAGRVNDLRRHISSFVGQVERSGRLSAGSGTSITAAQALIASIREKHPQIEVLPVDTWRVEE
jgi:hypothetical protein